MPYVRERMQQFVESTEQENMLKSGIFKKQRPTIRRTDTREIVQEGDAGVNFNPNQSKLASTAVS